MLNGKFSISSLSSLVDDKVKTHVASLAEVSHWETADILPIISKGITMAATNAKEISSQRFILRRKWGFRIDSSKGSRS